MKHIGIDLGAKESDICVLVAGSPAQQLRVRTRELPGWLAKCERPARVVLESCTQSRAVARAALAAELQAVVVPAHVVRALGVGSRGIKHDKKDAEVLALASLRSEELPGVFLRDEETLRRKEMLKVREMLQAHRRGHALALKAWLRGRLITVQGRARSTAFIEAVKRAAEALPGGLPAHLSPHLELFKALSEQLATLEKEIEKVTATDAVCQQLMAVPGVGPVIALAFTSHVAEPKRFKNADEVASYLALAPGEATTGGKIVRTSTIKAGPLALKSLLVQGAWSLMRTRPKEPMVLWAKSIEAKRGSRIAVVALARKLATVLWAMWRHDQRYQPERTVARAQAATEVLEAAA